MAKPRKKDPIASAVAYLFRDRRSGRLYVSLAGGPPGGASQAEARMKARTRAGGSADLELLVEATDAPAFDLSYVLDGVV